MDAWIRLQDDIMKKMERGYNNFKKSPKERIKITYIETRLESLEKQWLSFEETHRKIIVGSKREEYLKSEYNSNDWYSQAEDLYTDYKTAMKDHLSNQNTTLDCAKADGNQNCIKLPRIVIPTFSGHYSQWTTFRDLFLSLVHKNNALDNVQKLHYLKSYLTGEAEKLLRHLPITSENYLTCWNTLEHRFNNKKFITDCILKRFFDQKNVTTESANGLKELFDTTNECLNGLKNEGINIESWDLIVIYILCSKLDNESRKQWEAKVCSINNELPTLQQFLDFIEHRFRSLEFLCSKVIKSTVTKSHHVVNDVSKTKCSSCSFCSNTNHKLGTCKEFTNENLASRRNFVQKSGLCFNCLGANHSVASCPLPTRCRICKRKHHSLLHESINDNTSTNTLTNETPKDETKASNITTCYSKINSQVILATALVNAVTSNGSHLTLRSLLDQGSQASFITESAAQLLGLKKVQCNSVITGVGGEGYSSLNSKYAVFVKLQSLHDPSFTIQVKALVLSKLTSFLPERKLTVKLMPNLPVLKLADPKFMVPNKIDLLLGAEVYCQIITEGLITGPPGTPIAQNTRLGWILSGTVSCDSETNTNSTISTLHVNITNEDFNLKQFWELESENFTLEKQFTPEEKRCEEIFKETTKRDVSGRYIVKLPFKNADPSCKYGNSRDIAIKRFVGLEKRFTKSPYLKSQFTDVIEEYLKLGHMKKIPSVDIKNPTAVYLPYHEVIREDKTTTKFRVVFNASSLDNNGVSLNSNLLVGPTLQSDLRHIIMRWRLHPICLVADIVKMYRQVKVAQEDADYQRLVWREDHTQELQHLRLVRVTFGTASAPYLAVRTLHQVAYDEGNQFQLAASKVLQDFYMDDLLTGCQTVAEGKQIFLEMNKLLSKGGFELQKWSSNDDELFNEINKGNKIIASNIELKNNEVIKILGLTWNRRNDTFEYSILLPPITKPVTKRKVISDIARLFDPMGWISPAIIKAKIMIQRLWLSGIEWDDELPPKLLNDWVNYREKLVELTNVHFPRWINFSEKNHTSELHGFCDASSEAYAAVVYMRVLDDAGNGYVHLVTAKTRVAPIKQVSIPRLELCGAVLLAKLLQEVSAVLKKPMARIHAWTDSTVVLAWLSSHPSRWKTFVANRVSEILSILNRDQWSHVSSNDNPADCASRGIEPNELAEFQLWKTGPVWLKDPSVKYDTISLIDTQLEEKGSKVHCITEQSQLELWTKFSSLRKLVRVLAYCRRFIRKLRRQHDQSPIWLTSTELNESLYMCIKQCQAVNFAQEIKDIKNKITVFKKSKLTSLNPFLDTSGILRVGGRLEQADIKLDTKHPIILPSKSHLTELVLAEAHNKTLHGGPQLTLNYLRSKYWVLDAKNRVKSVVHKCVICARHSALTREQLMGQLPPARVTPIRAFYRSGVDYAGPIQIRASKGRGMRSSKGYICLFVCMATRAIHLEAVSDLTSQGFLAAFKRFVARRGHCADLFSDNGTNFVGAARELRTLFAQEKSSLTKDIAECLANDGTTWHFIPPYAPHFGGLWEAGIKSTKHHLRRVIGNATLTFEELTTLLYQIEACLNSRPLSQISQNSEDPTPLTPAHFLIGEPITLIPENNFETSSISSLKRWQLTQQMLQHFWRRWSREYLTQFLHRYKWANKNPEPEIGNLVLVKEDDLPPAKWLLGRIVEKHPGLDNITRVVTLKCNGVLFKRPISKLCILPITQ